MMGLHSSIAQRKAILKRWMNSGLSLRQFGEQEDIPSSTLFCWKKKYLKRVKVTNKSNQQTWSAEEKFAAVLETATLSEVELSAYCREKGLYPDQIDEWKESCIKGSEQSNESGSDPTSSREYKREIKLLKRELQRKEKALAETAALLVLGKKFDALWEESEED